MAHKAPGKHYRKGMTLLDVAGMFGDEERAKAWIAEQRWPDGPYCPHCGSVNVQSNIKHKTMTHRCRDCPDKRFFLDQDWHRHGGVKPQISRVGGRPLSIHDEYQGHFQYEAPS